MPQDKSKKEKGKFDLTRKDTELRTFKLTIGEQGTYNMFLFFAFTFGNEGSPTLTTLKVFILVKNNLPLLKSTLWI